MKKVLSVAMASAMVLGMGANAFAIQYNVASKDTAEWPEDFKFAGELFVTDKDGKKKATEIEDENDAVFNPGDVIWMPLYADDQIVYDVAGDAEGSDEVAAVKNVKVAEAYGSYYFYGTGYYTAGTTTPAANAKTGYEFVKTGKTVGNGQPGVNNLEEYTLVPAGDNAKVLPTEYANREVSKTNYYVDGKKYSNEADYQTALAAAKNAKTAYITVDLKAIDAVDDVDGSVVDTGARQDDVVYTGNIDKDWSINLIEEKGKASELIEKAELYKATKKDASKYGTVVNGVYLKVTLKDEWKSVETVNLKYHVYVAENGTENKTNKVWVSGDYENKLTKPVSFTWTNNANTPAVWEVEEGSGNGVAVFDYNDKAFFTVKMYEGEKLYLDLGTAYDRAVSNEIWDATGAEVDSFYSFVTADKNFSRTGELVLVTDDDSLVPYQVDEDGNLVEVDAEYVKGYAIAHTNEKVNGFVFNTKELGNYILSEEIVVEEEEEPAEPEVPETETPAEPEAPVVEEKPNPNTGAEDFVGLAVSLAVVSVAAAGALALKK